MLRKLFTLSFIIFGAISFFGQDVKATHHADKLFNRRSYEQAVVEYAKLDSITPNDPHLEARLGICHYFKDHNERALVYLEKSFNAGYRKDDIEFYLAKTYMLNAQFDKALKLLEIAKTSTRDKENSASIPLLQKNCKNGVELIKKPVEAKITNMGKTLNSPQSDYAPNMYVDEKTIIFTSRRDGSSSGNTDEYGEFFEDIYISNKTSDGQWTQPVSIGNQINSQFNDANINLSLEGGELFIYKNDTVSGMGDIYLAKFKDKEWSKPEKFEEPINSVYNETSICYSPDKDYVFFTSDREGGLGGLDLYYSKKDHKTNKWSEPKNMGSSVNTEYDEESPFMHADGRTLYFCSEGHNSMGGFDIFQVNFDRTSAKVGKPTNLGYPISTPDDDLSFVWSTDGTRGYFSTFREDSYGDRDLYMISRPKVKVDLVVLNGRITVGNDKKVEAVDITIVDNETGKVVAHYDSTQFLGDYAVSLAPGKNYALYAEKKGFLTFSKNIQVAANEFSEQTENINLLELDKGALIVLKNTFFKDSSAELKGEMIPELDRYADLIKKNPNIVVEIASHAFDYGNNHQKNYDLSQKRAEAVVKYLVEKGKVNPELLKAVGYGDLINAENNISRTEFIILQKIKQSEKQTESKGFYVDNGTTAPPKERLLNDKLVSKSTAKSKDKYLKEKDADFFAVDNTSFRNKNFVAPEDVEVKGTVSTTGKSKIKILDGDGNLVKETYTDEKGNYDVKFQRIKGMDYIVVADNKNKHDSKVIYSNESGVISKELKPVALSVNDKFFIRNLHFASNQDVIDPNSYVELNKLVLFLQTYPNIKVEIGGHTDGIGNYAYNKALSDRRATQVKKYLVLKHISPSRITAKGYGKSMPLASNDDEAEGRELNRRTEIKIIQ